MKNKFILILFCIFSLKVGAMESVNLETKIFKNLRCIVCQGQSIAESNSDFAQTIKVVVRDKINQAPIKLYQFYSLVFTLFSFSSGWTVDF